MRKTKIICTIGPASEREDVLTAMCQAGMNVARLNFSHGTYDEHKKKIELIKKVREKLQLPIAIMLDTKGPEYRIGTFINEKITLESGDPFVFTTEDVQGDQNRVSVNYKDLMKNLSVGDRILVNNGLVVFEVVELREKEAVCRVLNGGTISNRKSMSFPNKVMSGPYLSERDKQDLLFGIERVGSTPAFDLKALCIFILVCATAFLYSKWRKKPLSPIVLILFSGGLGLLLFGV